MNEEIDRTKPVIPYGCEQCPQNNRIGALPKSETRGTEDSAPPLSREVLGGESFVPRASRALQNKGYSYLFVLMITAFMGLQSIDLKFNKTDQWAFSTKEVPFTIVAPGLLLIAGVMGLDISAIALSLGRVLVSKSED